MRDVVFKVNDQMTVPIPRGQGHATVRAKVGVGVCAQG
jgi:hypothetical protein